MLQARAHRAGAKVASDAANQTNTAGVVRSALILRSNITEPRNDIVEKRQFPGAKGAPSSCPAGSIAVAGLRWCRGPANRTASQLRVATWWRYRLEYRKRQIGLIHNLTQSQYVIGAPEEIRTPDPQNS